MLRFEQTDTRMVGWMCHIRIHFQTCVELKERTWIDLVSEAVKSNRLWCLGHVLRKNDGDEVKRNVIRVGRL